MEIAIVGAEVGQVWEDEDGRRWRIVAFGEGGKWVYVKPSGYPFAASTQLQPSWLAVWTKVSG